MILCLLSQLWIAVWKKMLLEYFYDFCSFKFTEKDDCFCSYLEYSGRIILCGWISDCEAMTCNQLRVVTPFREHSNFPAEPYAVTGLHIMTRLTHMHLLQENNRNAVVSSASLSVCPHSLANTLRFFPPFYSCV